MFRTFAPAADNEQIDADLSQRRLPLLRYRLWRWTGGLALFIATLAIGNAFVAPEKAVSLRSAGHDFLAFYTAGTFVRKGRSASLYDLTDVRAFQEELARENNIELGDAVAPWWNPPFYALVFAPLSMLSYHTAWLTWMTINIACAGAACWILASMIPAGEGLSARGLVPLIVATSLPFIQSLGHGQNSSTSLLLLAVTVAFWRNRKALTAGLVVGLLFYKPQLGAVLSLVLVLSLSWRALAGVAITGTTLLLVNLIALPGTIVGFLSAMKPNLHYMQAERLYVWDRHVTLTAFWRYLLQGNAIGETSMPARVAAFACVAVVGVGVGWALYQARKQKNIDATIAITVLATPLLMPFYFDYDLLLFAVPAVLFAVRRMANAGSIDRLTRWQTVAWIAMFAWLFVNAPLTSALRVNVAVLLDAILVALAASDVLRARRSGQADRNLTLVGANHARVPMAA